MTLFLNSQFLFLLLCVLHGKSFSWFLNTGEDPQTADTVRNKTTDRLTSGFMRSCNSSTNCVPNLICLNNVCTCPGEKQVPTPRTLWDNSPKKRNILFCVARAGAFCGIPGNSSFLPRKYSETLQSYGKVAWNKLSSGFGWNIGALLKNSDEEDGCITNSRCNGFICKCNPGYFEDSRGFCARKKDAFHKCSRDSECDDTEMLVCGAISGRCECPSRMVFDIRTMKCHLPVGTRCEEFQGPIRIGEGASGEECVPHAECSEESVCECSMGFRVSSGGRCGVDHGLTCDDSKPCADIDLSCHSGRCRCKYMAHQYYDVEKEECVGKVSAPCGLQGNTSIMLNCTENAVCVAEGLSGVGECRCAENHAEDKDGKCEKTFGALCSMDEECDDVAQLCCVDGKCNCPDELQVFDGRLRKCRGLVGSRCSSNVTLMSTFRTHGVPILCTDNAFCDETLGQGVDGRCKCRFGFQVQPKSRTCVRQALNLDRLHIDNDKL